MPSRKELTQILYEKIKNGEVAHEGKLFPERKIAELLQVSRPLLRQAIAILEAFGIVEIRGRDGIYLQGHDLKNVADTLLLFSDWPLDIFPQIFEMRTILEPQAARLAAQRRTTDDLIKMQEAIRWMCSSQGGSSDSSNARYAKWNKIFHSILARATQNQVFVRLMDGVLVAYEQATLTLGRENFNYSSGMWPPESVDEHQNILNAIESQDEEKAVAYILKHLDLAAFRIKGLTCKFNIKMPAESIKWRGEYQAENEERENAN